MELNPFMRFFMTHLGIVPAVIIIKGILLTGLFILCVKVSKVILTTREKYFFIGGFSILIVYYSVIMYLYNFKAMQLI